LAEIAAERVQSELNYLLSSSRGTAQLQAAWQDGLFQKWFPDATAEGLQQIATIDQTARRFKAEWSEFFELLQQRIRTTQHTGKPTAAKEIEASGSTRNALTTAKLASLLSADPAIAETQLWQLKYSRAEIQAVITVLKALPTLRAMVTQFPWSLAQQYFFFQSVGVVFPAVAVSGIAHGFPPHQMGYLLERYLDRQDPVAHPTPLVSGQDLIMGLGISPSPQIGKLLATLQLARAEGKIHSRQEALTLAATLLQEGALTERYHALQHNGE
ncbi:MAG: hypothetical protein VKJ24_12820, partial [Synechococcales bacterium]|nr:hypothetical protein [Synechococcales bacterium]